MESINVAAIASQVVWLAFSLGVIFGAVAQRTHFCTMGAIADIVNIGDWNRMRQWLLAIAVAIVGANLLAYAGIIDFSNSIYTTPRFTWLSHLVGGALFGFGMVLASGCGSKTLVRIGAGNLKSLVVFIVLGLTAFMTLKGILAVPRVGLLEPVSVTFATTQDLPSLASTILGDKQTLQLIISGVLALLLLLFVFAGRSFRTADNLVAGIVVGCVIVAAWYVSGHIGYVAEDPNTLEEAFVATNSGRMESFSFVAPYAYTLDLLMMWTDASKAVSFGIAAALGVIAGSFAYSVAARSFRWEGFGNVEDAANHLIGAALMGFGGVTALGCTIGQGLSGISTLAVGSMLTFAAIVAGAVTALKYQAWRIERMID
jgi:uncharacterized membrane protein YedE/YeeE